MNSAVGPRKVSAPARMFHNTAIAVAALLSCVPAAWSQTPPADKAATPPAATQPKKAAAPASSGGSPTTPGGAAKVKAPTNAKAQASYSLGVSMGDQLHHLGLTADSIATERLTQGLRDALAGKVAMGASDQENIANYVKTARNALADNNRTAAKTFLTTNGKKPGVVTTASGLEYHVISE